MTERGWGPPARCDAVSVSGDACALEAGHDGNHLTAYEAARYAPPAPPSMASVAPATASASPTVAAGVVSIVGALLMIVATVLPWVTLESDLLPTMTLRGIESGDGWIGIGLAVVGMIGAIVAMAGRAGRAARLTILVGGIITIGYAALEFATFYSNVSEVGDNSARIGAGLVVLLVGAVLVLVGASWGWIRAPRCRGG